MVRPGSYAPPPPPLNRGSPAPSNHFTRGSSRQQQQQVPHPQSIQPQQHTFKAYQPVAPQQQRQHQSHYQQPVASQPRLISPPASAGSPYGGHHFNNSPHAAAAGSKMAGALGTFSTYASRIREANSALILPPALGRRAKRAVVSMAESDEDDWDFEDSPRSTPTRHQKQMA
ncbi:hypothetical protein BGZ75_008830, partial [Mortierella antarctica]